MAHTAMMVNILVKLIHACDEVVDWVTAAIVSNQKALTLKMRFFHLCLAHDVILDSVELDLQSVNSFDDSLHAVCAGFFLQGQGLLLNEEVDFLRLAVQLGPAE